MPHLFAVVAMQQPLTVPSQLLPMPLPKRSRVVQPVLQQLLDCEACGTLLHGIRCFLCSLEGHLWQASTQAEVDLEIQAGNSTTDSCSTVAVRLQNILCSIEGHLWQASTHAEVNLCIWAGYSTHNSCSTVAVEYSVHNSSATL